MAAAAAEDPSDRSVTRRKSMSPPPTMSELRIVLLGKSLSQTSRVGNSILDRSAFETNDPPRSAELHCESVGGHVKGRYITFINAPHLYDLQLPPGDLSRMIKECVSLSEPGPHAFLLVVESHDFTEEDRNRLRYILNSFSDEAINYSIVINTDSELYNSANEGQNTAIHNLREDCRGRHHSFPKLHGGNNDSVCQLFEKIDQMEKDNGGGHRYQERSTDLLKIPDTLRIVLLGKTGTGKSATGNTILGKEVFNEDLSDESVTCECQTETAEVCGRQITVIDTPGLFDTSTDYDEIMKKIVKCIYMAAPGPHAFLLVLRIGHRFTQEEREAVRIIEKLFGEKCNMYTIVLFTGGDMLKGKTVEQYVEKAGTNLRTLVSEFGDRYHAFNNNDKNNSTQVLTLLNKIDEMVALNGGSYYTNEMFQRVEMEKQAELHERILKEKEEQMKREREELEAKHKEEIERLGRIIQEERQKQEKHQLSMEMWKMRGNDLEDRLKSRNVEMQQMKETIDLERQRLRDAEQKYDINLESSQRTVADLEDTVKSRNVELQKIKDTFDQEKQRVRDTELDYKLNLEGLKRKQNELEDTLKLKNVELQKMNEIVDQERQRLRDTEQQAEVHERIVKEKEEQMKREREELEAKHKEEIERLGRIIQEERQKQEKHQLSMEMWKMRGNDLEATVKSRNVEMQQMKETIDLERQRLKDTEQNCKMNVEWLQRRVNDLEDTLKSKNVELQQIKDIFDQEKQTVRDTELDYKMNLERLKRNENELEDTLKLKNVELQQMKETIDQERQRLKDTEQKYEINLESSQRTVADLEATVKSRNVEMQQMKETVNEERLRSKTLSDQLKSHIEESKINDQKERMRKAEEEKEQRALEAELQKTKERLQEEEKMNKELQSSYETMKEAMQQKDQSDQERINELKTSLAEATAPKQEKHREQKMEENGCEERKNRAEQLFIRLNLVEKYQQKLKPSDVLQITPLSLNCQEPCTERELVEMFIQRLLMMDYRARYITTDKSTDTEHTDPGSGDEEDLFADFLSNKMASFHSESHTDPVHPMDVQMAVFHCSDHFLKQLIVNKLAQCQYALPLLVPNPFTREIEFPLWTFRQIIKSWKTTDPSGKKISKTQAVYEAETPMVAFFRFGSTSSSKSQLMNSLINEKHHTFFHRHCTGSTKNRLLMDGVVEIAWYCPSGKETDHFPDCVAFCNLHGDAETNKGQLDILTQMSSVNVVLLSDAGKVKSKEILDKLYRDTKPLICLFSEDESRMTKYKNGKYRIGLKHRNLSDVAKHLRMAIKECVSNSSIFKIRNLYQMEGISKDEDDPDCKGGHEAADKLMSRLKGNDVSKLKEKNLPCQGKLWHDWCEINKDLHRLQGNNLEMQKSEKQREMKQIREEQNKHKLSGLMEEFIDSLNLLGENEKLFFLKWVGIFLDKHTADDLLVLYQKYNEKWTAVLDLKRKHDKSDKMMDEQKELEHLSEKLNAAMFGLEHILREMGQIYETFTSVQTHKERSKDKLIKYLPKLAAELMKSGHPVELMDGDAAHVPLIWVLAVLDELVKILGDQRVFVLSVLGIQSSGKSTMLNAMFGLQFTVSAGRCTRGAFMQLVRVSEEMKEQLKFDYILVIDTEGLRALELAGKSTQHHDNELATFVVGLGNLTLINIFGENPAEMQDILQIVVQAFLRMNKVRINPRCMFVHQNVSDIRAGEKNMEVRRRLQEKLDEMAKLAAKEEDSEAECFSDVIEFSVQDDVYYFAQLWEGSPPMAPPNPCYSRNVQNLKKAIFRRAEKSAGMSLSQFKSRVSDLWNALLNENFVFSFKNTLEIAVYRKLENEFVKWTWTIRCAMLDTEEKLHHRIENGKLKPIEEKDVHSYMKETKEEVDKSMKSYFEEDKDKDILIQWRARCETKITQLYEDLVKDTKQNVNEVIQQQQARVSSEPKRTQYDAKLFSLSKDLALELKRISTDEHVLKDGFDHLWDKWVTELTQDTPKERRIDFWEDAVQILSVGYEQASVCERKSQQYYRHIDRLGDYSCYISKLRRQNWVHYVPGMNTLSSEDNELVRTLIINVIKETKELINKICNKITRLGYKDSYIQEITDHVRRRVEEHQNETQRIKLKKEFTLDLCLHVCELASDRFTECHKQCREANDPRVYLSKQKPQYYSVFKNYCRGATTTKVFGDLICSNLRESILQSVYNKTAIGLAAQIRSDMPEFNGNRSNLEKHILICLADEQNFVKYMEYIHNPREHFTHFITEKVNEYMTDNNTTVLKMFKGNLKDKEQRVINALYIATEEVKKSRGDADMWMRSFRSSLTDDLNFKEITFTDPREITDFDFLQQVVGEGLTAVMSELDKSFNSIKYINMEKFSKKPDEILIEHLCQCCWVQCPFCKAICTNTIEGHDGDHSVPFHRVDGITGWHYTDTTHLACDICTTNVQSERSFYPGHDPDRSVPYNSYRSAGGDYATWSITPDYSQLTYWKWFVCRFQKDLEKHYEEKFEGSGEIPSEWRRFTKGQAIECLDEYI